MEVSAQLSNARMAPRKLRQYRQLLVGMPVTEALAQLRFLPGKGPQLLQNVLQSAVANAGHNFDITADQLRVADVVINEGLTMKRFNPVSRGMAHSIFKRTSHIEVIVEEVSEAGEAVVRQGRKSEIETVSVDEYTGPTTEEVAEDTSQEVTEEQNKAKPEGARASETELSKDTKVFQKVKMQQQGGDRAKSHRRVTKKGDS